MTPVIPATCNLPPWGVKRTYSAKRPFRRCGRPIRCRPPTRIPRVNGVKVQEEKRYFGPLESRRLLRQVDSSPRSRGAITQKYREEERTQEKRRGCAEGKKSYIHEDGEKSDGGNGIGAI